MIVREMRREDVPAVHAIEVAATTDPWSAELFADELTDARTDRHWLVACDGTPERVVGFGGVMLITDEAHVMNLAVAPDRRRQGLAGRLLARLLLDAGDRGSVAATLEVRAGNEAGLALYRRFGFAEAGRRPRYYPDGEDAVIMWLHGLHRIEHRRRLEAAAAPRKATR